MFWSASPHSLPILSHKNVLSGNALYVIHSVMVISTRISLITMETFEYWHGSSVNLIRFLEGRVCYMFPIMNLHTIDCCYEKAQNLYFE